MAKTRTLQALCALLLLAGPAAAAPKPITGRLSRPGYTVIALAQNGRLHVAAPKRDGRFRITPPAAIVTLQLRDPRGKYGGPVVVGGTRTRALLGVRAGSELGRIRTGAGGGRTVHALPARRLVRSIWARAVGGVPIGAKVFGRVRSTAKGPVGPGNDGDRDGVPGVFDVDDDGDLRLDNVDPVAYRAAPRATTIRLYPEIPLWILNVGLETSYLAGDPTAAGYALNVNARNAALPTSSFDHLSDVALDTRGILLFPKPTPTTRIRIQCAQIYCSVNGKASDITSSQRWPADFFDGVCQCGIVPSVQAWNPDREGIGTTQRIDPVDVGAVRPHAGAGAIGTGDMFVEIQGSNYDVLHGVEVNYVASTVPALAGWGDAAGNHAVSYPVPHDGAGTERAPIELTPEAQGHYVLHLALWRPQRKAIPGSGEGDGYVDLGNLYYTVVGRTNGATKRVWRCPGSAYLDWNDGSGIPSGPGETGFFDRTTDQPSDPSRLMALTIDLSVCRDAAGRPAFADGGPSSDVFVVGSDGLGDAAEGVGFSFKPREPAPVPSCQGKEETVPPDPFWGTWNYAGAVDANGCSQTVFWHVFSTASAPAATSFGIKVYGGAHVQGGSCPDGFALSVEMHGGVGYPNVLRCTGDVPPGSDLSGTLVLESSGTPDTSMDILAPDPDNPPSEKGWHLNHNG